MKNIRNPFARLFSVVMLLSLCCLFTACPDDHPKDNVISKSELKSILLKNKWILHTDEFNILGPTDAEYRQDSYCLYFMNETAGTSVNITKISDTYDGHTNNLDFSDFTYTIDGNEVTLKFSVSGTSKLTYSDGVLKEGSLTYYPSALNSSDYEVMSERKNKQQYEGNYEFDYIIGFDNSWPSVYEKGVYTHLITLVFGVPENTYIRGISQFGIAIYPTNGEIDYKRGFKDDVWVEKRYVHGLQAICYTGSFSDNKEHNFVVTILFTSNSKTAKFKYAPVFYTDKNGWTDGHAFADYEYVPKNISGDDSSNNNNGNNGNNNNSSSGSLTGTYNGHDWVDLGLPSGTLWATCNIGASKPEGYGDYYAWGELEVKSRYDKDTYKYGSSYMDFLKSDIGVDIAGTSYDVAHVKWGGSWSLPTPDQCEELIKNTTSKWTSLNGVKGMTFNSKNGQSIFLPAAGQKFDDKVAGEDSRCNYMTSSQSNSSEYCKALFIRSDQRSIWTSYRFWGNPVRPVFKR